MGTRLTWNAEGGTDGDNITNGNTGGASGTATVLVTPSNTTAMRFEADAARHGGMGLVVEAAASTTTYMAWSFDAAASRGNMAFAWQAPTALPSGDVVFCGLRGGAALADSGWMAQMVLKSTGAVHPRNAATVQLAALPGLTVVPGQWYWVELAATKGTGTGDGLIEARMWADGDAMPALTAYASENAGTNDASRVRIAVPQSGVATMTQWFDDLQWEEGMTAGTGIGRWPTSPPVIGTGASLVGTDFTGVITSEAGGVTITGVSLISGTYTVGNVVTSGNVAYLPAPTVDDVTLEYTFTDADTNTATAQVLYPLNGGSGSILTFLNNGGSGWAALL